jgi:hypothetical protein
VGQVPGAVCPKAHELDRAVKIIRAHRREKFEVILSLKGACLGTQEMGGFVCQFMGNQKINKDCY